MGDFDHDSMSRHFAGRVRLRRDLVMPDFGHTALSPRQYRHPRRPYPNTLPTARQNEPNLPMVVTSRGDEERVLLPTPYAAKAKAGHIELDSVQTLPSKALSPGKVTTFKSGDSRLVLHNKAGVVRVTQVGGDGGGGVDTLLNVGDSVDLDPGTAVEVRDMDGTAHTLVAFQYH